MTVSAPPVPAAAQRLRDAVDSFAGLVERLALPRPAAEAWGPREVLAHMVFWHEAYLRTLAAIGAGRPPQLPAGTFAELNAAALRESAGQTVSQLCGRLRAAQARLESLVSGPLVASARIQVKDGSVARPLGAFLAHAEAHVRNHEAELRRTTRSRSRGRQNAAGGPDARAYAALASRLETHEDPSVRLWILTEVREQPETSTAVLEARRLVKASGRVEALLSERRLDGTIPHHPYRAKWYGAHWVLVALAELGYPAGDESLWPLLDQDLRWLHSADYTRRLITVRGLPRMHASIDANAVWASLVLGLPDARIEPLVERLLAAQWPDGGWNCDRRAGGHASSFTESLVPWRALAAYSSRSGDGPSARAASRAAELFLRRRLFRRLHDGAIISPSFVQLHYPCYWHYDILAALTVAAEAGVVGDGRCSEALELLESKWLPEGGFLAEHRYYRPTQRWSRASGRWWTGEEPAGASIPLSARAPWRYSTPPAGARPVRRTDEAAPSGKMRRS